MTEMLASPQSERQPLELDDVADREELRQRYYGLLQEVRVILPGVQVLLAFLLTAPFAAGFDDLDTLGKYAYIVALDTAFGSIVCLLTPTVFHRVADRTARGARLIWGVRLTLIGIALLAISLTSALWSVSRLVLGGLAANATAPLGVALIVAAWIALPRAATRRNRRRERCGVDHA